MAVAALLAGSVSCTGPSPTGASSRGDVRGRPGAAGVGDPYFPGLGNGGYDVRHYGLTLDWDPPSGRLTGTAEITARATQDLSAFNLDLAGMTVTSTTVGGERAANSRAGSELTLRPARGLKRGSTFVTVVRYSGVPKRINDPDGSAEGWLRTGGRVAALGEPTGSMAWFPGNNHPSDKATYDVRVTVPDGLTAVSNGELTRTTRVGGGRTAFSWHSPEPMASYLATVAIGPYETHRTEGTGPTVPTFTAVDPAVAKKSAGLLAALPGIVKWEERMFGPYPFSSTGVIIGREQDAQYALETQTRPFLPGPTDVSTLVHELSHQWFGDSVTPKSWRDMWLNEGFATYAEWLWSEKTDHKPVAESFDEAYADNTNWTFPPARPRSAADISQPPVYGRGAMVLQRVRLAVGDATFFRILRDWPQKHRHGNASTADFTSYAEQESGKNLAGVWKTWLYGYGGTKPGRGDGDGGGG